MPTTHQGKGGGGQLQPSVLVCLNVLMKMFSAYSVLVSASLERLSGNCSVGQCWATPRVVKLCCSRCLIVLSILRFFNYSKGGGDVECARNSVPAFAGTENPNPLPQHFILQQKQLIHFCVIYSLALHFSEVSLEQLATFLHSLKE